MRVTVIVPVYNAENYLARCLDSLLDQTYQDYEIICVNDCSTDNSADVLDLYKSHYPDKITVIDNKINCGPGRSRDYAVSIAHGEYISFVDSDDYVKRDYIERYMDSLIGDKYDIVVAGYIKDIDGKKKVHKVSDSVWSSTTYALACTKMISKAFMIEHDLRFASVSCGEDIYFYLSAFYYGAHVKVIDYAGYYYVLNRKSITSLMDYRNNQERIMAQMFESFVSSHNLSLIDEDRQRVIEYTYLANMINSLITFNHGCGIKLMKEKYDFVQSNAESLFPTYRSNPYVGLLKPKGQTTKIRLGVGVVMLLEKFHLARPFFYLVSLI